MKQNKLPKKIKVCLFDIIGDNQDLNDEIFEAISDYLSNKYGFCHYGFDISKEEITINNISWDMTE